MTPYVAFDDWSVDQALDLNENDDVTSEDWKDLGRLFVVASGPMKGGSYGTKLIRPLARYMRASSCGRDRFIQCGDCRER